MDETILEVKDLSISFSGTKVLSDISFKLERGKTIALVGPNGAGKSVLLRAILGLIPCKGEIVWAPNTERAYIPQLLSASRNLPLTVRELFDLRGISPDLMHEMLQHVELDRPNIPSSPVGQLSGGQFQRIMIAWAVAQKPDVLLFDEPAGGIDIAGQKSVYELVEHLQKEHGISIILVSHDLSVVYRYADHVICLNQTMTCHGTPREALTPEMLEQLYGPKGGVYEHSSHHDH